jgi:hypothetical protein
LSWNNYVCECDSGYYWWGTRKGCQNKRPALGNICTGQNKCYNNNEEITCPSSSSADFYGQDAQYADAGFCIPQSFTVQSISNKKVVVDNNTDLMWQQTYGQSDLDSYCSSMTYAGYSDWRYPKRQELLTIVDISKYNPTIDTKYFSAASGYFLTSEMLSDLPARFVNFKSGELDQYPNDLFEKPYVRCVRGTTLPTGSLNSQTINGNVIVTDSTTGLIWQTTYSSDGKTWQQALSYCETLTYAGYSDWRLPNKNELASLLSLENMPKQKFWSSSSGKTTYYAWYLDFRYNYIKTTSKTAELRVRCVRND